MQSQTVTVLLGVCLVTVTAGCGILPGGGDVTFEASSATVDEQARSDTGYEEVSVTEQRVEQTFSVANQSQSVTVINHLGRYERQVDLGPLGSQRAAVFTTFASPEVKVLSQTFNPLAKMSKKDLVNRFESQYESITVGQRVGTKEVRMLGSARTVERYDGTAQLAGSEVDVYIQIAKFKHGSDFIATIAIYPQQLSGENEHVETLMQGLDHSSN